MMAWWDTREPREKLLIALAGLLLVVAVLQQALVHPLLAAHAEARGKHDRAVQVLDIVASNSQAIEARRMSSVASPVQPTLTGDALRAALTALAAQRGLDVSRLQTTSGGGFSISMETVDPQQFFEWLSEAEALFGADVQNAVVNSASDGQVRVTIDFAGSPQ